MKGRSSFHVGSDLLSRRDLLKIGAGLGAAGLMVSALGTPALALGGQVEWGEKFDSAARSNRIARTSVPTLSPLTIQATETAIAQYADLVARGGWAGVPTDAKLRLGSRHANVVALRQRLMVTGDLAPNAGSSQIFDSYVEGAVRRFQARHGLIATGLVAEATFRALNVPADVRLRQLETNIVRLRSMATFLNGRFVMLNIPAAEIEAVEDGAVASRHTAVVGKPDRPSPVQNVKIIEVNFNPFWTVPASIIRKDLIPLMQKDPNYLTNQKIRIYDQRGNELLPTQVNWNSDEATNYMFRQDPGEINSLGSVRINMPNKEGVYMHDTPSKSKFGENFRFHSSGCSRVQNVRELVAWLLAKNGDWDRHRIDETIASGERIDAKLVQAVPVYWVYITAWAAADGQVQFREDIYGRDGFGSDVAAAR